MPVVLTTAPGVRRSGHLYDDKTGIAYEYPAGRYDRWIIEGEQFLYYEPKQGYFGCGVIGSVHRSHQAGRNYAEILSYEPFARHVSIRSSEGSYYEEDKAIWKGPVYWAQGVRPLSAKTYDSILSTALLISGDTGIVTAPDPINSPRNPGKRSKYAPAEIARAVEAFAVGTIRQMLRMEFPTSPIREMPRNNPGFDILVGSVGAPEWFVEVKGTQSADPVFFMSEGERRFSCTNAEKYRLYVVSGIDLLTNSHARVDSRQGALMETDCKLRTTQWRGSLEKA